jgi:RNA polymerase sigma factor (TIGR02999 family)
MSGSPPGREASPPEDITLLLRAAGAGDRSAVDRVSTLLYDELRRLAGRQLRSERAGHTLQTTALVHEAYLRLAGSQVDWQDRVHFLALAARQMRRILVDHARGKGRAKRGQGAVHVSLNEVEEAAIPPSPATEITRIDGALSELARLDERKARLIELQVFAGLTYEEMAAAAGISLATVHRELRLGRAWIEHALAGG